MKVSCIMPTRNRHAFIERAIECFLSQDYAEKQLVIVDNGRPIDVALPSDAVYVHVGQSKLTTGEMRNRACDIARGELICHWDDDDWSHPSRLSEQVALLMESRAAVVGYRSMHFIDETNRRAWLYNGEPSYALGTSLLYHVDYWASLHFQHIDEAEDNAFIRDAQRFGWIAAVDANDRMVARVHPGNTCSKENLPWPQVPYEMVASMMTPRRKAA